MKHSNKWFLGKAIFLYLLMVILFMSKAHAISEDLEANRQGALSNGQFNAINKGLNFMLIVSAILGTMLLLASVAVFFVFHEGIVNEPKNVLTWIWLLFVLIEIVVSFSSFQYMYDLWQDKSSINEKFIVKSTDGVLAIKESILGGKYSGTFRTVYYGRYYLGEKEYAIFHKNLFTKTVPEENQNISFKKSGNRDMISTEKIRIYYLNLHYKSLHPLWSFEKSQMIINYEQTG